MKNESLAHDLPEEQAHGFSRVLDFLTNRPLLRRNQVFLASCLGFLGLAGIMALSVSAFSPAPRASSPAAIAQVMLESRSLLDDIPLEPWDEEVYVCRAIENETEAVCEVDEESIAFACGGSSYSGRAAYGRASRSNGSAAAGSAAMGGYAAGSVGVGVRSSGPAPFVPNVPGGSGGALIRDAWNPVTASTPVSFEGRPVTAGALYAKNEQQQTVGQFPLCKTEVTARLVGPLAGVDVTQHFANDFAEPIEAVYVFPLPTDAAVNEFLLTIGMRRIHGLIRERAEAERLYAEARAEGRRAALLTQERPNIFTQNVANIAPGETLQVSVRFVHRLNYREGEYTWTFPMVVGPRYIPSGGPSVPRLTATAPPPRAGVGGGGWAAPTAAVPDADRITPPVMPAMTDNGHRVSLRVELDAGLPIRELECPSHLVDIERPTTSGALVKLRDEDHRADRDFVLRYRLAGDEPLATVMTSQSDEGDFALLLVEPPLHEPADAEQSLSPLEETNQLREFVFVLDVSGSMSGVPLETAKALVRCMLQKLRADETFQIVCFASSAAQMAERPCHATPENVRKGLQFIDTQRGNGGTEMLTGIRAALLAAEDPKRTRMVFFLTDGSIGNEDQIFQTVHEIRGNAHIFAFGIGNSVNHLLIEGLAKHGDGMSSVLRLGEPPDDETLRTLRCARRPLLKDLRIESEGGDLVELSPPLPAELWHGQPIALTALWRGEKRGTITLKATGPYGVWRKMLPVSFEDDVPDRQALRFVWARSRIDTMQGEITLERDQAKRDAQQALVRDFALEFGLMSPYTAFVAIDSHPPSPLMARPPLTFPFPEGSDRSPSRPELAAAHTLRRVVQPVDMPEGVRHQGVFGTTPNNPLLLDAKASLGAVFEIFSGGRVAVIDVAAGSPADRAGLQPGDFIAEADHHPVAGLDGLRRFANEFAQQGAGSLRVHRDRKALDLKLAASR